MELEKLKILIVDDNKSFREAARLFLENEFSCKVVGEASNGFEFLSMIKNIKADIILMDIQMPELDGFTATKEWCFRDLHCNVIAVTMYSDRTYLPRLIESGFKGCVNKMDFFSDIINAIEKVKNGGFYFNGTVHFN